MTIHIAGFWLGVLTTIVAEVLFVILFAIFASQEKTDD